MNTSISNSASSPFSTRRVFLQKGLALLSLGVTVPAFLDQTVLAIDNPADVKRVQGATGKDGKILIVLQLAGGNDGLNMVVPYADDAYHRARPQIGHDANAVLKIDNYTAFHPQLGPMKNLFDKGVLSIVQGVGYPNPNRSHFRATDIWESAVPERENVTSGWVGRYFDACCAGTDPRVGIAIGDQLPLAMTGERVLPLSFEKPESYRYNGPDFERYMKLNLSKAVAAQNAAQNAAQKGNPAAMLNGMANRQPPITPQSQLDFLHRTAMDAQVSSDQILRMTSSYQSSAKYPNDDFGSGLRLIASMIAGGLPSRVYYISLGGFDTHAGERARHDRLMETLGQGLAAFWADLEAQHNTDRVLLMSFSEFGRRVQQNASGGTDHGAAAPMILMSGAVRPGLMGRHPSLTDLDQGDLKYLVDFRSVYSGILQGWLNAPSKVVLGQQFAPAPIFKA